MQRMQSNTSESGGPALEESVRLKQQGNEAFGKKDFPAAIQLYS